MLFISMYKPYLFSSNDSEAYLSDINQYHNNKEEIKYVFIPIFPVSTLSKKNNTKYNKQKNGGRPILLQ